MVNKHKILLALQTMFLRLDLQTGGRNSDAAKFMVLGLVLLVMPCIAVCCLSILLIGDVVARNPPGWLLPCGCLLGPLFGCIMLWFIFGADVKMEKKKGRKK